MAVTRGGSVKHISLVELYAVRPEHSQEFGPEALRPVGAKRKKRMMDFFPFRFPRVPRRPVRARRCTRGYNPPPRWG